MQWSEEKMHAFPPRAGAHPRTPNHGGPTTEAQPRTPSHERPVTMIVQRVRPGARSQHVSPCARPSVRSQHASPRVRAWRASQRARNICAPTFVRSMSTAACASLDRSVGSSLTIRLQKWGLCGRGAARIVRVNKHARTVAPSGELVRHIDFSRGAPEMNRNACMLNNWWWRDSQAVGRS